MRSMTRLQYIALFVVICASVGVRSINDFRILQRLDSQDGGEFGSPGYSDIVGEDQPIGHYIKARRNQIIQINFLDVKMEDSMEDNTTSYIQLIEGRKKDSMKPINLTDDLNAPFIYVSTTNRIRIRMIASGNATLEGFRAHYKFLAAKSACDASNLFTNRRVAQTCNSIADKSTSRCIVRCRKNYRLQSTNVSTCSNGSFTEVACQLMDEVVAHCEKNELRDCPYSAEDVLEYITENRLEQESNLTEAEKRQERIKLFRLESGIGRRREGTCRTYCSRRSSSPNPFNLPTTCGRLSRRRKRIKCFICRITRYSCRRGGYLG